MSDVCQAEVESRGERSNPLNQIALMKIPCVKEDYVVQMGRISWTVKREMLGIYIAFFDLGVCFCGLVFWIIVLRRQTEYIDEFKAQQIESSDFTIRVENLPPDLTYGDNEFILRAKLWEHFQTLAAYGYNDK